MPLYATHFWCFKVHVSLESMVRITPLTLVWWFVNSNLHEFQA